VDVLGFFKDINNRVRKQGENQEPGSKKQESRDKIKKLAGCMVAWEHE
jgi:hypothetical protein